MTLYVRPLSQKTLHALHRRVRVRRIAFQAARTTRDAIVAGVVVLAFFYVVGLITNLAT